MHPMTDTQIDLSQITRIHFIGIGGIGMSSLAQHLVAEKKQVSGSDRSLSNITELLTGLGVTVYPEQVAENITDDIELVVYTEAMPADHPELVAARAAGIPTLNYFDTLALAVNPYYLIAVAGTHGKTTTTAMLTDVFEAAGLDPTAVIGSLRAVTGTNYRAGKSKYAIVEACEYKDDFLSLQPEILVITNLEHEHVDHYATLADVQASFRKLIDQVAEDGVIVTNPADPNIAPILEGVTKTVVDYTSYLDLQRPMRQPGLHTRMNAAAALAVAATEKVDSETAGTALSEFRGTWRRFEYKGEVAGAPVYDDYAHHPTEVKATIAATRELYPDRRLITVFKPHTYSRTAEFFDQFAKSFAGVDEALFLPIYAAREENTWGVTSRELAVKTLESVPHTQYFETHDAVQEYIREHATADTVVVVMGAGDVTTVASALVA